MAGTGPFYEHEKREAWFGTVGQHTKLPTVKPKEASPVQDDWWTSYCNEKTWELLVKADAEKGIDSVLKKEEGRDGRTLLFRKKAKPVQSRGSRSEPKYNSANYAVMGLTYWRTAVLLSSLSVGKAGSGKKAVLPTSEDDHRCVELQKFLTNIDGIKREDDDLVEYTRFMDQYLIPMAKDKLGLDEEKVKKLLPLVKDFSNLEFTPTTMATEFNVTLTDGRSRDYLVVDVPVAGLSDDLKKMYEGNIKEKKWFQAIDDKHIQALVERYAPLICKGRQIPTQLRKFLPGFRNAFQTRVYRLDEDSKPKALIYEGYHSGNLGHSTKYDNDKLTRASIPQLKEATGAGKLFLQSLISPANPTSQEFDIVDQISTVAKESEDVDFSNAPINGWRNFSGSLDPVRLFFGRVSNFSNDGNEALFFAARERLEDLLGHALGEKWWKKQVGQHPYGLTRKVAASILTIDRNRPACILLIFALEYYRHRDGSSISNFFGRDENPNLQMVSSAKNMAFHYNQFIEELNKTRKEGEKYEKIAFSSACQSGKDRQGAMETGAVTNAVEQDIAKDSELLKEADKKKIRSAFAKSGHIQKLAGFFGCTLGAEGILYQISPSSTAFPDSWQGEDGIAHEMLSSSKRYSHAKKIKKIPEHRGHRYYFKRAAAAFFYPAIFLTTIIVGFSLEQTKAQAFLAFFDKAAALVGGLSGPGLLGIGFGIAACLGIYAAIMQVKGGDLLSRVEQDYLVVEPKLEVDHSGKSLAEAPQEEVKLTGGGGSVSLSTEDQRGVSKT